MDLWGPAPVRSRGGHFYFLIIVDDYSRYVSILFLTAKLLAASSLMLPPLPLFGDTPCSMLPPSTISILILTTPTPAELWTGQKPSVRPLRVRGCTSYVLLNSQARRATGGKLAPKTITCVYLGHNSDSPDYLFLHPTTKKLYRSRDVFFDESHPFYPSSTVSPSLPPPSLTWADFDSLPPATTPSPPLPTPSTVSDPPSPASPSSTTQSPPLLPAPEPIPLKTYQRRPPAAAPPPDPAPPPAPPPSPIACHKIAQSSQASFSFHSCLSQSSSCRG
ncbi:unnamed protein product [Closterium sp. NIES-53]